MESQASKVSIWYAGVEGKLEIDMTLPIQIRVKQQEQRFEYLKEMHENIAGHTHGSLEGSAAVAVLEAVLKAVLNVTVVTVERSRS